MLCRSFPKADSLATRFCQAWQATNLRHRVPAIANRHLDSREGFPVPTIYLANVPASNCVHPILQSRNCLIGHG